MPTPSISVSEEKCKQAALEYIEELARLLCTALRGETPPPRLDDVMRVLDGFLQRRGSCGLRIELREAYEAAAKLSLDAAMEALAVHMESLSESVYAQLSHAVTRYAFHVARLVSEALAAHDAMEYFEPLVFASLSRLLALSACLKAMHSREVGAIAARVADLVEGFIEEEARFLQGVLYTVAGVAPGDREANEGADQEAQPRRRLRGAGGEEAGARGAPG